MTRQPRGLLRTQPTPAQEKTFVLAVGDESTNRRQPPRLRGRAPQGLAPPVGRGLVGPARRDNDGTVVRAARALVAAGAGDGAPGSTGARLEGRMATLDTHAIARTLTEAGAAPKLADAITAAVERPPTTETT